MSLGFFWSGVDAVVDTPREEVPCLMVVEEEELRFGEDELPVGEGSMAEIRSN